MKREEWQHVIFRRDNIWAFNNLGPTEVQYKVIVACTYSQKTYCMTHSIALYFRVRSMYSCNWSFNINKLFLLNIGGLTLAQCRVSVVMPLIDYVKSLDQYWCAENKFTNESIGLANIRDHHLKQLKDVHLMVLWQFSVIIFWQFVFDYSYKNGLNKLSQCSLMRIFGSILAMVSIFVHLPLFVGKLIFL